MSVRFLRTIGGRALRCTHRFAQRLRALRSHAEGPYSPAGSLALLLAVGIIVKFH
jgi:hypothetical protein